ncbi:fibronectin type III domain-containing protein [Candidatus Woesearchaeota archaeon]|nr:fibronectin type III domain-containing protein [Candidatus Woesearchaeota archaeon]
MEVKNHKIRYFTKKLFSGKSAQLGSAGVASRSVSSSIDLSSVKLLGKVFSFLAIMLWIIDIWDLPYLGGVYSGFNFNPQDFWSNWLSKFTFGNVWFDLFLVVAVSIIAVKYLRERSFNPMGIFASSLFALAMVFFISNPSWAYSPKAVLHFLFIILFGFFFIRQAMDMDTALICIAALLFFDFFIFSTAFKFIPFIRYISLLGGVIILWTFAQSPSGFTALAFVALMVLITTFTIADGLPQSSIYFEEAKAQKAPLNELWKKINTGVGKYIKGVTSSIEAQLEYASGGYYRGKVEKNQAEPLGVYLQNVKAAEPRFYVDEPVIVWGNVKARTLDDGVNIKIGCYRKKDEVPKPADSVNPQKPFTIFTLEEQGFECRFANPHGTQFSKLETGSNTITVGAEFNFGTMSFLKAYFIDRERLRAMTRENLDPFDEFGIKDKKPTAVYTNGPVAIGMETTSPLIGVSNAYITSPRVGITLENRPDWQGKIKKLKELVIFMPKGIKMTPETDCNREFKEYTLNRCSWGEGSCCTDDADKGSCEAFVKKPCLEVCDGYKEKESGATSYESCKNECEANYKKCVSECTFLFKDQDNEYAGYALNMNKISIKNEFKDIDRFRSFSCRFNPIPDEVLGNTPITTKEFRVKARYDYLVEKDVSVNVETPKGPKSEPTGQVYAGGTEIEKKIIQTANEAGFQDPFLALAVANWETRGKFNHCYDGSLTCNKKEQVVCNSFGSCGVMQINIKVHPETGYNCGSSETIFDVNCNIKSGIKILQNNYNQYAGNYASYEINVKAHCLDPAYQQKYLNYKDWDMAIRAYNGLGCAAGADLNYVEEVNRIWKSYKESKVSDTSVAPPTNFKADFDGYSVRVSWELSPDDGQMNNDVKLYRIFRNNINIKEESPKTTSYTDSSISGGDTYEYYAQAEDNAGNKANSNKFQVFTGLFQE